MMKKFLQAQVKAVDKEEGVFEVIASSGKVDRLGDTIDPNGWYLKNYKKNPVILWSHNTGGFGSVAVPPVGKADKIWIKDGKQLMIKGHFADTPFAQELKTLVDGGFLNAVSVGFLPLVEDKKGMIDIEGKMFRRANDDEVKKGIYDSEYGEKFTHQELLELSWVSVPALPQALVSAKAMNLELVTKALEEQIGEDSETEKEETKEEEETETEDKPKVEAEEGKDDDSLEKRLSKLEEVISDLQEVNNPKDATPNKDEKGRDSSTKQKSKKSETERMLIMFDKMIETLLRKLRQ